MKITKAGITSKILAIVDEIEKAGDDVSIGHNAYRRLVQAARALEDVASKLMEKNQ